MRFARKLIVLLLVLAWLPVTMHCQLEFIPGFEFLACELHGESAPDPGSHCAGEGCCAVESSHYKTEDNEAFVLDWLWVPLQIPIPALDESRPQQASCGVVAAPPPDLSPSWRFVFRTALPARAPSLAS